MKAVIYTRFSPRRNAEESESCETQEALCRTYAASKSWPVSEKVFADKDMSGSDADRPGLHDAIEALNRGDVLLVYKRDRLARDVLIAELTRRRVAVVGATIVAVSGDVTGDDNDPSVVFSRQIMDAVAELERKQIAIRTSDAMKTLQRKGRRMGRWAPYGYALSDEDPNQLVEYEPEQAAIRRIRELRDNLGLGVPAIVRVLNNEMPTVARGTKWRQLTVGKIVARLDD
jgi:DNA invertase Pin-like site-specific DNA recombinase